MCWNKLATTNTPRARNVQYRAARLGGGSRVMGTSAYTTFAQDGAPRGGMLAIDRPGPVPPHWLVYFAVSDFDGQTTLVQSLGGSVRMPPKVARASGDSRSWPIRRVRRSRSSSCFRRRAGR